MFALSGAPLRLSFAGTFQNPRGGLPPPPTSPSRLFHSLPVGIGSPPLKIPPGKDLSDGNEGSGRLPSPGYKWCLVISYDGTRYSGWQYQTSTPTVQCILEDALIRITKLERNHLCLNGAGRTDAGVHAWGQGPIVHLEVEGSGFLYRQVRNMVALLLQVGREAVPPEIVSKILASGDRKELAKYTLSVPPHGLCLFAVNYKEDHLRLQSVHPATSLGRHHTIRKCKLPFY